MEVRPKVSVVMSVYNNAAHLRESLQSTLAQTFHDFDLIVIDDGSTDESLAILREFEARNKRIRVLVNERNLGLAASLNRGLRVARGRYIARRDGDDLSLSERLRLQVEFLDAHPEIFLVGASARVIDENGEEKGVLARPSDEELLRRLLPHENVMTHPTIMFRNDGQHWYREKFRYSQDYDFYLRLLTEGKRIINIPEALIKYRMKIYPELSKKAAQQALFAEKAKEFYRQRLRHGEDEYDRFDPSSILNLDIETTDDPVVLQTFIALSFRGNRFPETRSLIRRYWRKHGCRNSHWATWAGTWLGPAPLEMLRRVARMARKNRPLRDLQEIQRGASGSRALAVFFPSGCGPRGGRTPEASPQGIEVFERFREQGWRVGLFPFQPARALSQDQSERKGGGGRGLDLRGMGSLGRRAVSRFTQYWQGREASVIVLSVTPGAWPASLAGGPWGAKVAALCNQTFGERAESLGLRGGRASVRVWGERWLFRRADCCIFPMHGFAEWAIRHYGLDAGKVRVIASPVDTEIYRPIEDARRDIDVSWAGGLSGETGYDGLLEAVGPMNLKMAIWDKGLEGVEWTAWDAAGLGGQRRERLAEEDRPGRLARSKIFVMAPGWLGEPRLLMEAMACGCACVGVRRLGVERLIMHGETGLIVDSNAQETARTIQSLLEDPARRKRLGENARRFAVENWSFERVTAQHAAILEGLAGGVVFARQPMMVQQDTQEE